MSQLEKIYGVHAVEALLRHHPKRVKQIWLADSRSEPRVQALLELAAQNRVTVGQAERREMDAWVEGVHQGVVAEVSPSQVWGENMLDELLAEDRRVLVFSQFTGMLALIEQALQARGIRYGLLTGGTTDRRTPVAQFQAGAFPVFLISLKAGGSGLNLTTADTVLHFDPWWNPAAEAQASDRAYRIGQDKPVFVYKLIVSGSIEEKILALQERKAELAAGILSEDHQVDVKFGSDDLAALFEPLPD